MLINDFIVIFHNFQIYTRNVMTINGHITGFIGAFDKHWNIVLIDAIEVWKRKKYHYCCKALVLSNDDADDGDDDDEESQMAECLKRLKGLNITLPALNVKSINRKQVECTRNVSKLLIRGEQIATIILDRDNEDGTGNKIQSK